MKITGEVLDVLAMMEVDGLGARIVEQIDRKLYTKTNKVLEALGGTWSRSKKTHLFGSDPAPRLDHAITTGEVETGQDVGFFPTPAALAARLVTLAGVVPSDLVLEPSAGSGRIVDALLRVTEDVYVCEWDDNMRHALSSRTTVYSQKDFLDVPPEPFDRVVMNPPFCKSGTGDHLDHVRHAYEFLKPGGVLVSVLPSSVSFRRDRRYLAFRQWAETRGTLEPLPAGSFKESGTGVNTVVARIKR